nr:MAG TPA: hypothetical protein [Caudoviricetes sp.]DAY38643.1 MAG TPA: hypothetical protein [Caudoviricetes sp.]
MVCTCTLKRCMLCIPKMELKNELKYTKKGSKKRWIT